MPPSDLSTDAGVPQGRRPLRPARFSHHDRTGELADVHGSPTRRASFRPAGDEGQGLEAVVRFGEAMEADAAVAPAEDRARGRAARAAALVEEAAGEAARGLLQLTALRRNQPWDAAAWRLARRLYRRVRELELIDDAHAGEQALGGAAAVYNALARLTARWRRGEDAASLTQALASEVIGAQTQAPLACAWRGQLEVDLALEAGEATRALELRERHAQEERDENLQAAYRAELAAWRQATGDAAGAIEALEVLREHRPLEGDEASLLCWLRYEEGQQERLLEPLLERREAGRQPAPQEAMQLAMMLEVWRGRRHDAAAALAALRVDDPTALRQRWHLLEQMIGQAGAEAPSGAGTALIDVLNRMLEGPLRPERRVALLVRLGLLYEQEAELEGAAAEVYREALAIRPDHGPSLRALGRIYTRRGHWEGVAEMYERELAHAPGSRGAWRRHFLVAEIYEGHLGQPERALEHLRAVLAVRPHYVPAIKACARLLDGLGRYEELVDLFLHRIPDARSLRQQLYMLGRVAELAEERLGRDSLATWAWERLLALQPTHPGVFPALGRLYSRAGRWDDLVGLNEQELESIDDAEERASLLVRTAEICARKLDDPAAAEAQYRAALAAQADYLPALEGLGRLLAQSGRWTELIRMTGDELRALQDPREIGRHLGALAEICEVQLGRTDDAIRLHEEILRRAPQDDGALVSLERLYRVKGAWPELLALLERRAEAAPDSEEAAEALGELALVAEWRMGDPVRAFGAYRRALEHEPANPHWLSGVMRHWHRAGVAPGELSERLEALLDRLPKGSPGRGDYLAACAALQERASGDPVRSLPMRQPLAQDSPLSRAVVRLALASQGLREALRQSRLERPPHAFAAVASGLPFERLGERDVKALRQALSAEPGPVAAGWLLGEVDVETLRELRTAAPPQALSSDDRLRLELAEALDGQAPGAGDGQDSRLLRLQALWARAGGDEAAFEAATRRECERLAAPAVELLRLLEIAERPSCDPLPVLHEASRLAFPELDEEEGGGEEALEPRVEDGPAIDRLLAALEAAAAWELVRDCLEANLRRADMGRGRRGAQCERLARLLERLGDRDRAQMAWEACWALQGQPPVLAELVRVALERGAREDALRFQQAHFDAITAPGLGEADEAGAVDSGLRLARLMIEEQGRLGESIDFLERLFRDYPAAPQRDEIRLELAYACSRAGRAFAAVEHFQHVLELPPRAERLEHWRELIRIVSQGLKDPSSALNLRWQVVRSCPSSSPDLESLAAEARALGVERDVAAELTDLARRDLADQPEAGRAVWRVVAMIYDEQLGWSEDAAKAWGALLALLGPGPERLHARRRQASCLGKVSGFARQAEEAYLALVREEPLDVAAYQGLQELYERQQALDRARVVEQVVRTLNPGRPVSPQVRTKTLPSRPLGEALVSPALLPAPLRGGILEVLQAATPIAERVWAEELPQRKALENDRRRRREAEAVLEVFDEAWEAFGGRPPRIWLGDSGPQAAQVVGSGAGPIIWLNTERIEGFSAGELRFVAGWTCALASSGLASLLALDGRQVWHLLEGVWYRQTGRGFSDRIDAESQRLADACSSPLLAVARRRLATAMEPVIEGLIGIHCEAWPRAIEELALRLGLILTGDVEEACGAVLKMDGWDAPMDDSATQAQLRRHHRVEAVLRFALEEGYLASRYALGLSGRPSQIGG